MDVDIDVDEINMEQVERSIVSFFLLSAVRAVKGTTRLLEKEFEAITRAKVRGNAWRAWKSQSYPRSGVPAYDPQGIIFVNGGTRSRGLVRYFTTAGTNRAKGNDYLAIPLKAALNTTLGRMITPRDWEVRNGIKLRPFFRPGKQALLVADGAVTGTGSFQALSPSKIKAKQRGGQNLKRATIPIFALISEQEHANSISLEPSIRMAHQILVQDFRRRITG